MRRIVLSMLCVALVLCVSASAFGRGMLLPKEPGLPPLSIKSHRVSVEVDTQLAVTKVEQVFLNNTDRVLEATYIFPLPPGAVINDFAMYMNGKRVSGELVEKEKARQVYTEIVRRMRDPGLLEYMGGNLLRLNIFPIPANSTQKIEVQYTEVLGRDSGMVKYVYPLKTDEPASKTLEDFTFAMTIRSKEPITNVYSPSHQVGVTRKGDREAVIGFEHDKAILDRDVVVYYTVGDKTFGMSLMTHRPAKDKPGYFMLLITPRADFKDKDILPRDVCFVLDTSGSMANDKKLAQAKEALKYCVSSLRDVDRFAVIGFSTGVNPMSTELLDASAANKEKAKAFIDSQEAMGGTALYAALQQALSMKHEDESKRPYTVVFLTDGRPTVGEDREDEIVNLVAKDDRTPRIFTWGVGYDVNTHLLDRIAEKTRALGEYVEPSENIEQKVSLFFNKLSKPVMAGPVINWGKLVVKDVYPQTLPDLFAGQQIAVFGRYENSGDAAIQLGGTRLGKKDVQTFEGTFGSEPGNSFVEKVWAGRHVGFLLDEIRLRGEKQELKDEVIRLSRLYGIQTPYTSYLILESKEQYAQHGLPTGTPYASGGDHLANTRRAPAPSGAEVKKDLDDRSRGKAEKPTQAGAAGEAISDGYGMGGAAGPREETEKRADEAMKEVSGIGAVRVAKEVKDMKEGASERRSGAPLVKRIGERSFYLYRGFWVDGDFNEKLPTLSVKVLSDACFQLIDKLPELKDVFALGERVIVVVNGIAVIVEEGGKEKLTDEELNSLVKK